MKNTKKQKAPQKITFTNAVKSFWTGYVDFNGRATRSQYWYAVLFAVVINFFAGILFGAIIQSVISAVLFLPIISLSVRRYHDAGISGWFYVVPVIVFTIWSALRETAWAALLNLDYFTPDLIVFSIGLLCFFISNIIICCMPSKHIK